MEYNQTVKENILKRIKENKLNMKPRGYFILRIALLGFVSFLVLLISVFILNFIFFSIRISGHNNLLHLGGGGVVAFILAFPWMLLVVDACLVFLLELLVRKYSIGYRSPGLYLFFGLFVLALIAGVLLDRATPVNDRMLRQADDHRLPRPLNDFYEGARRPYPEGFPKPF